MKLRIADRILVAIAGLLLLAGCCAIIAQLFFQADVLNFAVRVFTSESPRARGALIGLAVFMLLLGFYCLFVLFRHRKRRDRFILQKNDGGELAISIRALENMVQKCIVQHDELQVQKLYLENKKDGLLIRLSGTVAGGISIPLTMESLQKQIRQYVTACSGVEVKGIRVEIDASGEDAKDAPFAIAAPAAQPLLHEPENKPTPVQKQSVREDVPSSEAVVAQETAIPREPVHSIEDEKKAIPVASASAAVSVSDLEEDDERPLHQRLFSAKPVPCIVPAPPEETGALQEESVQDAALPPEPEPEAAPEETSAGETADLTAEEEEKADAAEERSTADPTFLDSLKAFDEAVTGKKEDNCDEEL